MGLANPRPLTRWTTGSRRALPKSLRTDSYSPHMTRKDLAPSLQYQPLREIRRMIDMVALGRAEPISSRRMIYAQLNTVQERLDTLELQVSELQQEQIKPKPRRRKSATDESRPEGEG